MRAPRAALRERRGGPPAVGQGRTRSRRPSLGVPGTGGGGQDAGAPAGDQLAARASRAHPPRPPEWLSPDVPGRALELPGVRSADENQAPS